MQLVPSDVNMKTMSRDRRKKAILNDEAVKGSIALSLLQKISENLDLFTYTGKAEQHKKNVTRLLKKILTSVLISGIKKMKAGILVTHKDTLQYLAMKIAVAISLGTSVARWNRMYFGVSKDESKLNFLCY